MLFPFTQRNTNRVLVIEDDDGIRSLLVEYLESAGYTVDAAQDGVEGLFYARASAPDVVVLDLNMPRMDGESFLDVWRRNQRLAAVPVVIYSGEPGDYAMAKRLGARAYLLKPVDLDVLQAVVDRVATT